MQNEFIEIVKPIELCSGEVEGKMVGVGAREWLERRKDYKFDNMNEKNNEVSSKEAFTFAPSQICVSPDQATLQKKKIE